MSIRLSYISSIRLHFAKILLRKVFKASIVSKTKLSNHSMNILDQSKMYKLAQRSSSVLGTSARMLAASSSLNAQQERLMSSKKAVVVNMGGCLLPAMEPVLTRYARDHKISVGDLQNKLFKDGDKGMMEEIEPALLSRHGSNDAALAHVVSALQSIRGEGLKTGLVATTNGLNADLVPVDKHLFDVVSPGLKADMLDKLAVDSSDIVYLDAADANLKAAQALGMHTVKMGDVEATLKELESVLKVPLKEFLPGFTWTYYDSGNNPYKSTKENLLYYFLCIYAFMVTAHLTCKHVLKIDGTYQH